MTQKELMRLTGYSQSNISRLIRKGLTEEMIIERSRKRKKGKKRVWRDIRKLSALTGYSESTIQHYWWRGMSDEEIIEKSKHKGGQSGKKRDARIALIQRYTDYTAGTIERYLHQGMTVEEICQRGRAYRHDHALADRMTKLMAETGYTYAALYQKIKEGKSDGDIIEESRRPYAHEPGLIHLAHKGILGKHKRKQRMKEREAVVTACADETLECDGRQCGIME